MTEEEYNNLPNGWSSKDSVDALETLSQCNFDSVLELGSFVGRSSVILAKHSKSVHCVDTWNGKFLTAEGINGAGVNHKSEIYQLFQDNIRPYSNVTFCRSEFLTYVKTNDRKFDLVFIDAGPKSDISEVLEYSWNFADRCMAGYHYYDGFRFTTDQVDAFAKRQGLTVEVDRCLWKINARRY